MQLDNTLKAAGMVCNKKEKDKKLTQMREVAEQLIKRKGKNLDDEGPLGRWLWEKEKECEGVLGQLAEQEKKAGVIQKRTLKKKAEAQEKERLGWSELAVMWQSVKHLHHESMGKGDKQLVKAPITPTCPPPHAPPAAPIPGIYPTLHVSSGTLTIDEEREELSEIASVNEEQGSVVQTDREQSEGSERSARNVRSREGPEQMEISTRFGARHRREEQEQEQQRKKEEEEKEKEIQQQIEELLAQREREMRRRQQETGEKQSKVDFRGEGQWKDSGSSAQVHIQLDRRWGPRDNGQEEESEEGSDIDIKLEITKESVRDSVRKAKDLLKQIEQEQGCRRSARIQDKRDRYKPFTVGDT